MQTAPFNFVAGTVVVMWWLLRALYTYVGWYSGRERQVFYCVLPRLVSPLFSFASHLPLNQRRAKTGCSGQRGGLDLRVATVYFSQASRVIHLSSESVIKEEELSGSPIRSGEFWT
ncbi:hypothetical protein E2C01_070279 [Portunus trituberculatus]|uniref:Uncharacterized protein n=1 Tax=Portunus trituberculatus TaxID=210409 RepID=A0A5B7HWV5_PORTR|nr:hypothetical protein [Portunus trituberculatus]